MIDLNAVFNTFNTGDTYHRVDSTHPLNLYIGIDDEYRWTMMILCDFEPTAIESSKMILARKGKRNDDRWTITLTLIENSYKEIFLLFCGDIIESSREISTQKQALKFIIRRYKEWREMLANSRGDLLSANEIKGLLGEMYFLHNYLAPLYGTDKAALSWTGPRKTHQDFIVDETWYEIKTISSSRTDVNISSIKQLDCNNTGELVIIKADKTSTTSKNAVNLNFVYRLILESINEDTVKSEFSSMLLGYGYYPRPEYEGSDYTFEVKEVHRYLVTSDFPCLRYTNIPTSIVEADYVISISSIEPYRKE